MYTSWYGIYEFTFSGFTEKKLAEMKTKLGDTGSVAAVSKSYFGQRIILRSAV